LFCCSGVHIVLNDQLSGLTLSSSFALCIVAFFLCLLFTFCVRRSIECSSSTDDIPVVVGISQPVHICMQQTIPSVHVSPTLHQPSPYPQPIQYGYPQQGYQPRVQYVQQYEQYEPSLQYEPQQPVTYIPPHFQPGSRDPVRGFQQFQPLP
jgi:hypothetical protein